MFDLLSGPWHWSFSGFMIAVAMFLLLYTGKQFGVSSTLRTMCNIAGAGKQVKFFDFDWKAQRWNLIFIFGGLIGGFLAYFVFPDPDPVQLTPAALDWLKTQNLSAPGATAEVSSFVPPELFNISQLFTLKGLIVAVGGGFLIGFGTRWAGGCTSGHAISGLSNLQPASLVAVIGFFIGGLAMSWGILPYILSL